MKDIKTSKNIFPVYASKLNPDTTLSKHNNKTINILFNVSLCFFLPNKTIGNFLSIKQFTKLYNPKNKRKKLPIDTISLWLYIKKTLREKTMEINKLKVFIKLTKIQSIKLNFNPFIPNPIATEKASIDIAIENKKTETTLILWFLS